MRPRTIQAPLYAVHQVPDVFLKVDFLQVVEFVNLLVEFGHGMDPATGIFQSKTALSVGKSARLQGKDAVDGHQVVLDPVMDLLQ